MLGFFRTNQLAVNLFLVIYVLMLRISGLCATEFWEPSSSGIFSHLVYNYLGTHGWLPDLISLILVLLQAILLNVLSAQYKVSKEVTMFPGLFYILLMSTLPNFLHLSPVLIGNTFLILALSSLFNTYKKTSVSDSIFNVGFWIGIASLFYFSNFVFLFLGIFGLSTLRNIRINEILMIFIGMMVPLFLTGTIFYLSNDLNNYLQITFFTEFSFWNFEWEEHWSNYVPIFLFGTLVLTVFLSVNIYFRKQSIRSQNNIQVLYYFIIVSILTVFFQRGIQLEQLLLLAIPLSLMLPLNFLAFRKKETGSGIHLIWLIGILFLQYRLLFM
ncbi:MAG: DUF6427 family protein [Saprospiraceae bacterium]|nr:DUF6427 family protein [Saprospiraceae bacterium]MDG2419421.1 DUF6427 family protein [Saprospiraceae bacterium]